MIRLAQSAAARSWQQESHVEFLTEGVLRSTNRCLSASKRDGNCVRIKEITWKPDHWRFLQIKGDLGKIYYKLYSEIGLPYDTLGAVMSVTPVNWQRQGKWFCSEHMAHGRDMKKPHRQTPGKLYRSLISEGAREIRL